MANLTFDEYQEMTRITDLGTSAQDCIKPGWLYYVLGLGGETGELLEKVKKLFRDNNGVVTEEFKQALTKELGDIQWYHARLAAKFGIKSSEIAETNKKKLLDRMERGKLHGDGDDR